jgi:hypothetical protein
MHNNNKPAPYLSGSKANLAGNRKKYRTTTPKHHSGNKYTFQFHGSGGFDLKHRVNESCSVIIEIKNPKTKTENPNSLNLQ